MFFVGLILRKSRKNTKSSACRFKMYFMTVRNALEQKRSKPYFKAKEKNEAKISKIKFEILTSFTWRRHPDLNRGSRICSPMPYHLAMAPSSERARSTPQPNSGFAVVRRLRIRSPVPPLKIKTRFDFVRERRSPIRI